MGRAARLCRVIRHPLPACAHRAGRRFGGRAQGTARSGSGACRPIATGPLRRPAGTRSSRGRNQGEDIKCTRRLRSLPCRCREGRGRRGSGTRCKCIQPWIKSSVLKEALVGKGLIVVIVVLVIIGFIALVFFGQYVS